MTMDPQTRPSPRILNLLKFIIIQNNGTRHGFRLLMLPTSHSMEMASLAMVRRLSGSDFLTNQIYMSSVRGRGGPKWKKYSQEICHLGESIFSDNWCMSHHKHFEMSFRGHANNFIGLYIEDTSCGTPSATFPTFVKCSGPGAIIPRDGASCTCGDGSTWNSDSSECECNTGYSATPYVNWRRNPICILCSGIGASGEA